MWLTYVIVSRFRVFSLSAQPVRVPSYSVLVNTFYFRNDPIDATMRASKVLQSSHPTPTRARFTEQSKALRSSAASETKLGRPASAPRLTRPASAASSAAGLQASRGISASLSTLPRSKAQARPQTSSGVRSTAPTAEPSEPSLFELRELPALAADAEAYVLPGAVGERLAHEMPPPAQQARRKGTQAWVQGDVQRAIQEFSSAIDLEPKGSRASTDALQAAGSRWLWPNPNLSLTLTLTLSLSLTLNLQLRCAGLLRAGRHDEALADAQLVVQALQGWGGSGGLASVVADASACATAGSAIAGRSAVAQAKLAAAAAEAAEYKVAAWPPPPLTLNLTRAPSPSPSPNPSP